MAPMAEKLSPHLFPLDPAIRYVAVNQADTIVEMEQRAEWPSYNPPVTDRLEELVVNPVILELARRRGELDLNGIRYVIVRYGLQYQVLFPYKAGHVSVGVELSADPVAVATKVAERLAHPF
jgi:predicted AAA+ superfamily ATPase